LVDTKTGGKRKISLSGLREVLTIQIKGSNMKSEVIIRMP
jgi:hypothetical protein